MCVSVTECIQTMYGSLWSSTCMEPLVVMKNISEISVSFEVSGQILIFLIFFVCSSTDKACDLNIQPTPNFCRPANKKNNILKFGRNFGPAEFWDHMLSCGKQKISGLVKIIQNLDFSQGRIIYTVQPRYKRSDITKPSYNKVIFCWSQPLICLCIFTLI